MHRLKSILDNAPAAQKSRGFNVGAGGAGYTYDANENLSSDSYKGVSDITYNHLNLPMLGTFTNGHTLEYVYDAGGNKLRKIARQNGVILSEQDYAGGLEYRKIAAGSRRVESLYHTEGRYYNLNAEMSNTLNWRKEYHLRDLLGNTRLTFADKNNNGIVDVTNNPATNEILQELHYYPFGLAYEGPWLMNDAARDDQYKYNGKEWDETVGWYDYGARYYDPATARWTSVDPLASDYAVWSPYNYVLNNPILLVDPTGQAPEWKPRIVSGGRIQLVAERGDNLRSLRKYLGGSTRFSTSQIEDLYNSAAGGVIVTLPEDNYSRALQFAEDNPGLFPLEQSVNAETNYNCYHFCINGVWEKEIYSEGSFGEDIIEPERTQGVLDGYFKEVSPDDAIYGETIVAMNYSGGYPQHTGVYAGKDSDGNIYILQKNGASEPPNLVRLQDAGSGFHNDFRFFNEKTAKGGL